MYRDIDIAVQHGGIDFLREKAFAAGFIATLQRGINSRAADAREIAAEPVQPSGQVTRDQRGRIEQRAVPVEDDQVEAARLGGLAGRLWLCGKHVVGPDPEALLGRLGADTINGRIDRLVITDTEVLVVDYKTNRPAPARIEDADPAYLAQMAVYVAVLREVFPGRTIEAALVWTDGPKLMTIPEELLAASLVRLGQPVDR